MGADTGPPSDWPEGVPWHKWPPFPVRPEGVTIIPFSQFVATGLQIDNEDESVNLDGEGKPTIDLPKRHDGEKKKRRKKKQGPNGEMIEVPMAWWEEDARRFKYDQRETYVDRLLQAYKDFMDKRRLPQEMQAVAHSFGVCLGLIEASLQGVKTNSKTNPDDEPSDDDSVVDPDDDVGAVPGATIEEVPEGDESKFVPETARERALDAFYQDPERVIKLFLTSYAYDKGVYWNEKKIIETPILVELFLKFLEDNSVFGPTEKSVRRGITQAQKIVELAKQEMPHTTKMARMFPDNWGKACGLIWGQRLEGGWVFGHSPDDPLPTAGQPTNDLSTGPFSGPAAETAATDISPDAPNLFEPTEAELLVDAIEPPSINGVQTEFSNTNWGNSGGWGNDSGDPVERWGDEEDGSAWNPDEFMGQPEEDPAVTWGSIGPSGKEQLEALIGPNNLPETYVTLRVEASSRIVGTVIEPTPNPNPAASDSVPSFGDIAQQRLARLTMLPHPSSKAAPVTGACVNQPVMLSPPIDESKFGWVGQHDPLADSITLLIHADEPALDILRVGAGMVVTAIFVQVAELPVAKEEDPVEAQPTDGEPPKKKKKKKGKKDATAGGRSWWFLYQIAQVYPTFLVE